VSVKDVDVIDFCLQKNQ